MKLKDIILKKGDIVYYKPSINRKTLNFKVDRFLNNVTGITLCKQLDVKRIVKIERPTGYETIYEAPKEILSKEEKEYLEAVLKPFKDRVDNIEKLSVYEDIGEDVCIELTNGEVINLPYFEKNTMYEGMEANKEYTLEELGLFGGK